MSHELVRPPGDVVERPRRTQWRLWALSLLVGLLAGLAAVVLRALIAYGEFIFFGATEARLAPRLAALPWWGRMTGPIIGGAIVALLLRLGVSLGWGPAPRPFGLEEVTAARRLRGTIRASTLSLKDAFLSALVALVSIASGESAGRECPSIHLGASLAILPGRLLGLAIGQRRMLLGMGAAAALAAALNAPIAGVVLARELVLPRQRISSLGPVAAASLVGWLVARSVLDGPPLLNIPPLGPIPLMFQFASPFLAALLALASWGATWVWRTAPAAIEELAGKLHVPLWFLPAIGGILTACIALAFPPVVGIGYAPLAAGLGGHYGLGLLFVFAVVKMLASAIAASFRFGGGRIAPALYVGAMLGAALGLPLGFLAGDPSDGQVFFGLVGMGVSLAVLLGAPLTAAMLVFELSSSPDAAIATLAAAFIARAIVSRLPVDGLGEAGARQPLHWR